MSLWNAIGPSDNGECGMKVDQAKRLKDLESEAPNAIGLREVSNNARLKRLLVDAELDKAILKEAALGNW